MVYMQKSIVIFRLINFFALVILATACNTSSTTQAVSDYDKLCKIYEEVVNTQTSQSKKYVLFTVRIEKEIPSIFALYQNAALVDGKNKYQFYKEAAQKDSNKQWDCEIMKLYFEGKNSGH